MESLRQRVFLVVNIALLAAIVFWLREHISLSDVMSQLRAIPLQGPAIALVLNIAALGVYGVRLAQLLEHRQAHALAVVIIGFGMNGVLPFRLGELAKLAYARQLFGIAPPRLLAATASEKMLDLCALLMIGFIASQFVVASFLSEGLTWGAVFIVAAICVSAVAVTALRRMVRAGRKTHPWITDAFDTLRAQHDAIRVLRLVLFTVVIWCLTVGSVYWMFRSVTDQFSFAQALVLTLVLALAIAIPSTPAGLGVVEAAIAAYLQQALQVDANQALASALAFHFVVVVPQVLVSAVILLRIALRTQRAC